MYLLGFIVGYTTNTFCIIYPVRLLAQDQSIVETGP